jgi:hypothetical protein
LVSRYTAEEKAEIMEKSRQLLEELANMLPYEPAAEEAIEAEPWPSWERGNANHRLIRYGIALADPHGLDRWRADAEAQEHRFETERAAREQREAEIRRQQQVQAMSSDANWNRWIDRKIAHALDSFTFNDFQRDVIAMVLAEERKLTLRPAIKAAIDALRDEIQEAVGELRRELEISRGYDKDKVLDLPALPIRRRSDAA